MNWQRLLETETPEPLQCLLFGIQSTFPGRIVVKCWGISASSPAGHGRLLLNKGADSSCHSHTSSVSITHALGLEIVHDIRRYLSQNLSVAIAPGFRFPWLGVNHAIHTNINTGR
jgi:hypothetical protein